MPLCFQYEAEHFSKWECPQHGRICLLDDFFLFQNNSEGCVQGTRRQAINSACAADFPIHTIAAGGGAVWTQYDGEEKQHTLMRDNHGLPFEPIDLIAADLPAQHVFHVGGIVYMHWAEAANFPGGWYQAQVIHVP